jgi:hypothetical protein
VWGALCNASHAWIRTHGYAGVDMARMDMGVMDMQLFNFFPLALGEQEFVDHGQAGVEILPAPFN